MKIVIDPKVNIKAKLKEFLSSFDLILMLAWRDILVRYKQAALGIGWSLLRPIMTTGVFVIVFGKVARLPSEGLPYSMLILAALIPWMFFAHVLTVGASSLIDNAGMLRRTYLPKLIMPVTSVIIHFLDSVLALLIFTGLSLYFGVPVDVKMLFLPFFLVHVVFLTCGVVYYVSVLAVRWRDIIYLLPFLTQIGFFISPIGYSTTLIPNDLRHIFYLNPMVGLVEAFRWSLLAGKTAIHWDAYFISLGISIVVFASGVLFFTYQEQTVSDYL